MKRSTGLVCTLRKPGARRKMILLAQGLKAIVTNYANSPSANCIEACELQSEVSLCLPTLSSSLSPFLSPSVLWIIKPRTPRHLLTIVSQMLTLAHQAMSTSPAHLAQSPDTLEAWSRLSSLKLSHCDHDLEKYIACFAGHVHKYHEAIGDQEPLKLSLAQQALMFVHGIDGTLRIQYSYGFDKAFKNKTPSLDEVMDWWRAALGNKRQRARLAGDLYGNRDLP